MFTVKIDDGFCEWEFKLKVDGKEFSGYSIQKLVDAITNNTELKVVSERFLNLDSYHNNKEYQHKKQNKVVLFIKNMFGKIKH